MNLKIKIFVLAGVPIVALLILVALGWFNLSNLSSSTESLSRDYFLPLVNDDFQKVQSYEKSISLLLEADRDLHQAVVAEKMALAASGDDEIQKVENENLDNIQQAEERIDQAITGSAIAEATELYPLLKEKMTIWKEKTLKVIENVKANDQRKMSFARKISAGSAKTSFDEMRDIVDQIQQIMQSKIEQQLEIIEKKKSEVETLVASRMDEAGYSTFLFLTIGLIASFVTAFLGFVFGRQIITSLNKIIQSLGERGDAVMYAAEQLASGSQQMAEGASEQASSLEEVSSSLEEMASMTKQNADNASAADSLARESSTSATEGNESMDRMRTAIAQIKNSADETAKIVKTIDEIAFQTNLLALNAAVEAARAGEAGKGFAVVAEEVRNLAQRSADAAKSTAELILESQQNANNGVKVSDDVSGILSKILGSIQKVASLVSDVSAASNEQSRGVEQINHAVAQMDQLTQGNAANAEEGASSSSELKNQASVLNQIVEELQTIVGSNSSHAVPAGPPTISGRVSKPYSSSSNLRAIKSVPSENKVTERVINPEQVIPFDDKDLMNF